MKSRIAVLTAFGALSLALPAFANDAAVPARGADAPTWAKDVAPIVYEHCAGCHRPGQIGPMALLTFEQVRPWAKAIREQVSARKMPPWFAHPDSRDMKGDLNLSDAKLQTILAWVDAGTPRGNPNDAPPQPEFETFEGGWQLKQPDLVLEYPEAFNVGKEVDDEYRCFPIALGLDHDVWLKSVEFQPGNNEVVHHFILFDDKTGRVPKKDASTPEPGCECGQMDSDLAGSEVLQMWAPGNVQPMYPEGVGKLIPAGANLVLQVHYHNVSGADQMDQSRIGLHLAQPSETINKRLLGQLVSAWQLDIPAGEDNVEHQAVYVADKDMTLYTTGAHMHYRGKDMGLWAEKPDGEKETLIWVPNFDFNWQLTYEFVEPYKAPKGTKFTMISHHDNSENNPHNPVLPPIDVKFGLASSDEMAFSGFSFTYDDEELGITPQLPSPEAIARLQPGDVSARAGSDVAAGD